MRAEELFKAMIRSFFMITTGVLISTYIFCLIFRPDAIFSLTDIGRILLLAVAGDLPYVIFLSRRELSRQQMLVRNIVHLIVLSSILAYFVHLWGWVRLSSTKEVLVFLLSVLAVYVAVFFFTKHQDKQLSDKINDKLKERYR